MDFREPLWLWVLAVIPIVWGLFFFYNRKERPTQKLEKLIDKHLIPYLLVGGESKKKKVWTHLLFWSLVWSCLGTALAGPRWQFQEIATFTRDQNLAILLDLSESMNAKDIFPSRLGRAKQKIEDLLNMSKGVKIGLIAFAADPHMLVPITEDKETIRHLLPSLSTDLVYVQGSKLGLALEMAANMLKNEPGNNKAIVVVSDGGFEDASASHTVKTLAEKGIVVYTIGVGSLEGAPFKDRRGDLVKKNGSPVLSKLEKEKFKEISKMGQGRYFDADHSEQVALIFEDLKKRSDIQEEAHKTHRFWEEHFYLFLLPVLPFFLWWARKGSVLALLVCIPICSQASLFTNSEQQAALDYEIEDYDSAYRTFRDPYRKGIAAYRMGDYKTAEEMFRQSARPEVASSAGYNLGNALYKQNKLEEAVTAYEDVLKKWPDHTHAKENLAFVKQMMKEQQSEQQQKKGSEEQNKQQQKKEKEEAAQNSEPKEDSPENEVAEGEKQDKPPEENEFQEKEQEELASQEEGEKPAPRSQEDLDADLWLDQIKNDPKAFLKNKFYLESKKNGTKEEIDPW